MRKLVKELAISLFVLATPTMVMGAALGVFVGITASRTGQYWLVITPLAVYGYAKLYKTIADRIASAGPAEAAANGQREPVR